ncbi:conserved unknown protein [Ectocarpus siliculosus]|uniref:N-acetyltransferase domain-containing protein n=1 Tax=Ectocarpus siliculosus TaxID=2880 RepID=D7FR19_ECTSI|nr:conserved unknown protein [Ectocarpus siliculosus]|eukprot:CBJ26173.1 conserved unknown protein [Ectocarpus siliculosus]
MLTDMPCEKGLNFRFFDQRTNKQWFKGYWALARIIRRRVYCEEMGLTSQQEFTEMDPTSRHVLIQMGDAPLGYGRWRFETGPAGQGQGQGQQQLQYAMVDRLCVLKEYRQRGFAKSCLERIVHDVSTQTAQMKTAVAAIVVPAPPNTFAHQKLGERGWTPQDVEPTVQLRAEGKDRVGVQSTAISCVLQGDTVDFHGTPYVRMCLFPSTQAVTAGG